MAAISRVGGDSRLGSGSRLGREPRVGLAAPTHYPGAAPQRGCDLLLAIRILAAHRYGQSRGSRKSEGRTGVRETANHLRTSRGGQSFANDYHAAEHQAGPRYRGTQHRGVERASPGATAAQRGDRSRLDRTAANGAAATRV